MAAVESTPLAAAGFDAELLGADARAFVAAVPVLRLALEGLATFFRAALRGAFPFVLLLAITVSLSPIAGGRGLRPPPRSIRGNPPAGNVSARIFATFSLRQRDPARPPRPPSRP